MRSFPVYLRLGKATRLAFYAIALLAVFTYAVIIQYSNVSTFQGIAIGAVLLIALGWRYLGAYCWKTLHEYSVNYFGIAGLLISEILCLLRPVDLSTLAVGTVMIVSLVVATYSRHHGSQPPMRPGNMWYNS